MKFLATCFLLFAAAGVLPATPITVTAELTSAGSPLLSDKQGNYVGPYTIQVNGVAYAALCVDFEDNATLGQSYSAYETAVGSQNLSETYHPTGGKQYEEEAYLMSLILKPGADRIDIQHAAWAITDSSYKANGAAGQYVSLAAANYQTVDFSKFEIISGAKQWNCTQEFMIETPANSATPEPATMLLTGGGLLLAGLARRGKASKA